MRKFSYLMFNEILLQNKLYKLIIYNVQFLLLGSICLFFVCASRVDVAILCGVFLISGLPISTMITSRNSLRDELADGSLDMYMISADMWQIIMAKFFGLLVCNIISFLISLGISAVIYAINIEYALWLTILGVISLVQLSGVAMLLSSVEAYFRSKANLTSLTVIPLIVPNLIITGMAMSGDIDRSAAIWILCAIAIIITPISLSFSGYLVRNIYNI